MAFLLASSATAQIAPSGRGFRAAATSSVAVSSSSATALLPTGGTQILVSNFTTVQVCAGLGSFTASCTNSTPIPAGGCQLFDTSNPGFAPATMISAIAPTGSGNIIVQAGEGIPLSCGGGGGGGGSSGPLGVQPISNSQAVNPATSSQWAVNLNQLNGSAPSVSNPLFAALGLGGAAVGNSNPLPASIMGTTYVGFSQTNLTNTSNATLTYPVSTATGPWARLRNVGSDFMKITLSTASVGQSELPPGATSICFPSTTTLTNANSVSTGGTWVQLEQYSGFCPTDGETGSTSLQVNAGSLVSGTIGDTRLGSYSAASPAFTTGQIVLNPTTATLILATVASGQTQGPLIQNCNNINVWLGASGVTSTTGYLLPGISGGQCNSIAWPSSAAVYGISSSGAPSVNYVEFN